MEMLQKNKKDVYQNANKQVHFTKFILDSLILMCTNCCVFSWFSKLHWCAFFI